MILCLYTMHIQRNTCVLIFSYESMASLILFNVKLKFNPILRIDQMSNSTQDNVIIIITTAIFNKVYSLCFNISMVIFLPA